MNETTPNSQKTKCFEMHVEWHGEGHPVSLPWICAEEPLSSAKVFLWDSDQDYTAEDRYSECQNCPAGLSPPLHGATSYYPLRGQNPGSGKAANHFPNTAWTSLLLFHPRKWYTVESHPTRGMTEWSCSSVWKVVQNQLSSFVVQHSTHLLCLCYTTFSRKLKCLCCIFENCYKLEQISQCNHTILQQV